MAWSPPRTPSSQTCLCVISLDKFPGVWVVELAAPTPSPWALRKTVQGDLLPCWKSEDLGSASSVTDRSPCLVSVPHLSKGHRKPCPTPPSHTVVVRNSPLPHGYG